MRDQVTTGIEALDALIDGLFVGDNVIWYDDAGSLLTVKRPDRMEEVAATFYEHHQSLNGTVRFIFESLTGMRDLWEAKNNWSVFTCAPARASTT